MDLSTASTAVRRGRPADRLLARARDGLSESLALLADLVAINSHADNVEGVAACGERLGRELDRLGFRWERVTGVAGELRRPHLFAERPPKDPSTAPTLLLLGHLDTVFPPDHPFQVLERDGERWNGPGVSDMKGGWATAVLTLRLLEWEGLLDRFHVRVLGVGDEEVGSPTADEILGRAAEGADLCLCFEAARPCGGLVLSRRGHGVARVVARGRTGHAGIEHDRCPNAFTALCRWVVEAEDIEHVHRELTVSAGGPVEVRPAVLNMVPDHASCELEWRYDQPEVGQSVRERLHGLAERISADSGAELEVEITSETPPMHATDASRALLATYREAAAELGLDVDGTHTSGVGDVNVVAGHGAVCLDGVGPEGGGFHTEDEWVSTPSIAVRAAMNALALTRHLERRSVREGTSEGQVEG